MCARKGVGGIIKGHSSIKWQKGKWCYASGEWLVLDEIDEPYFNVPVGFEV